LGKRNRLGRDETHRRADCRRNDYVHHSRSDSRAGLLRDDEGARAKTEHSAQAGGTNNRLSRATRS